MHRTCLVLSVMIYDSSVFCSIVVHGDDASGNHVMFHVMFLSRHNCCVVIISGGDQGGFLCGTHFEV